MARQTREVPWPGAKSAGFRSSRWCIPRQSLPVDGCAFRGPRWGFAGTVVPERREGPGGSQRGSRSGGIKGSGVPGPVLSCWCERGDSNPHGFPRQILSLVRLPVPPLSHVSSTTRRTQWRCEGRLPFDCTDQPRLIQYKRDSRQSCQKIISIKERDSGGFSGSPGTSAPLNCQVMPIRLILFRGWKTGVAFL